MQLKYLGKDFLALVFLAGLAGASAGPEEGNQNRLVNRLDLLLHRQSFIECPWVRRRPRFEHPPAFPVVSLFCLGRMGE